MVKRNWTAALLIAVIFTITAMLVYRLPAVQQRAAWRLDFAYAYVRGIINPVSGVPTPLPPPAIGITPNTTEGSTPSPSSTVVIELTAGPTRTLQPSATPLPQVVALTPPAWEKQDINNCGPASMAMYLRYYGWEGDQFDLAELLKPQRQDRNVNVEELAYYVRTRAGWLNVEYRVGGNIDLLKQLLATGVPVMIEESFYFEDPYWPNDDLWAAHYNLLTGYDDLNLTFTGQDSFHGPDQQIPYATLEEYWHSFNNVYILVYPPEKEAAVKDILGEHWDVENNRQLTLGMYQDQVQSMPDDAFAWFNLGTNLVYFERYQEAAQAYDRARELGLPQRMLRYQFGPFFAYFHTRRIDDLMALTAYALQITPNAEEAMLWQGWGHYRNGDTNMAVASFQAALAENPNYLDAQYALDFVR